MLALADQANDDGFCWPSLATIANKANLSRRYVIRIINKLEREGLIQIEKRMDGGEYTSNMYKLVVNKRTLPSEQEDTTPSEQEDTTPSEQEDTGVVNGGSLKPSVNQKNESISIPESLQTDVFLDVWGEWQEYRKQIRKKLAPMTAKRQLKRLAKYSPEIAAAMLNQSIENQWTGIFELKDSGGVVAQKIVPSKDGSINV